MYGNMRIVVYYIVLCSARRTLLKKNDNLLEEYCFVFISIIYLILGVQLN